MMTGFIRMPILHFILAQNIKGVEYSTQNCLYDFSSEFINSFAKLSSNNESMDM